MQRRGKIQWLGVVLSGYVLLVILFIFVTHLSAIQASHPAYEITLMIIGMLALIALGRSLFERRS